jgi:hypothetical protein
MYMMDITINYKNAVDFMDNKHVMKMILNCAIEKEYDIFNGIMIFKKTKLYSEFDKNFQFALICKGKVKKIIGFFLEKLYFNREIWTMDTIYITPTERKKGYCYDVLLQYSLLEKAIISSPVIANILIKINMRNSSMDKLLYTPNFNINKGITETLINKDRTINFLCRGLVDKHNTKKHQKYLESLP